MPYIQRRGTEVGALLAAAAALQVAAAVGLSYVTGFGAVRDAMARFSGLWPAAVAGSLALSFTGYYFAYCGAYGADHGPSLDRRQMDAVITVGFGGFLAHGAGALDKYALRAAGAGDRDASVQVAALAGIEQAIHWPPRS